MKLERKLDREGSDEIKKLIASTKLSYEKKKNELSGAITRELKKVCWNYANLYFAYMTLSKNYHTHTNNMFMCTINNYLSLFTTVESLKDVPELAAVFVSETEKVLADINQYVDTGFVR